MLKKWMCCLGSVMAMTAACRADTGKPASFSEPITINIGESDLDGSSSSEEESAEESTKTAAIREKIDNEIKKARKLAEGSPDPSTAFPHYCAVFFLDDIKPGYLKMQGVDEKTAEMMKSCFKKLDTREQLGNLKRAVDDLNDAATQFLKAVKEAPGNVADMLVKQGYDPGMIREQLPRVLGTGPIMGMKKSAELAIHKTEVVRNLIDYMNKWWGRWKMGGPGGISIDPSLPGEDLEAFRKAVRDTKDALRAQ